jgi:MYXO-CTERM domain-containing protein
MNTKKSLAFVSTSALAAGMAQGSVVYSGPLNLPQTYSVSQYRQGVSMGVSGTNDFVFGFEADPTKPYVDARTFVGGDLGAGGTSGLMSLLAKANHGLPVTPSGTMIDASYASLYPALPAGRAYMNKDGDTGNVTGDWSDTATTDGYVGIELALGGGTSYGWLHFIDDPSASSLTLVDWAYESTPNLGIEASVVPEPSVCALGALGLAGLLASRRRH